MFNCFVIDSDLKSDPGYLKKIVPIFVENRFDYQAIEENKEVRKQCGKILEFYERNFIIVSDLSSHLKSKLKILEFLDEFFLEFKMLEED